MEGGTQSLGKHLGPTSSSPVCLSDLSVTSTFGDSHVCCCCIRGVCPIDGLLKGELFLKRPLLYSVSDFRFHQNCDALGTSPSLPPPRALASNFPLQETSAG